MSTIRIFKPMKTQPRRRRPLDVRLSERLELPTTKSAAASNAHSVPKVMTQTGSEWRFFPALDISHFRALDKYVSFEDGGQEHLTTESLKRLALRLGPWGFLQIHRATLVNMANVARVYRHATGYRVVLRCGQEMPVARRAMQRLRTALGL